MNIYDGVYKSFEDAKALGPGFLSDVWIDSSKTRLLNLLNGKDDLLVRQNLLPFLIPTILKTKVRILDFGGGIGVTYAAVSKLVKNISFEYHIVDNERICQEGRKIFKSDKRVIFHNKIPRIGMVDIVHIGSSLQYVDDWRALLGDLYTYEPKYFLFDDLHAGNIPAYVTLQNYYESKIPCWFFSLKEVIDTMKSLKYKLIFESKQRNSYFGREQKVPLNNLPKKYQIEDTVCLLFKSFNSSRF